jgi:F0F1-type ATP synthase membrane subunit c/vacuolar-type H+-ATPase subunit K
LDITAENWDYIGRFIGAGFALGLGGIGAAVGMGMAAAEANEAIMRQPERQGYLLRTMLIGQAVGGSPSIFALVIGLLILFLPASAALSGPVFASAVIGAGLSIGLGCFGSGVGCGWPAAAACSGVARNPQKATPITSSMIIGQAVAQSPSIFSTVIALILLFIAIPSAGLAAVGIAVGSGLAMGASALGPGIGSGTTAGGAVRGLSAWPGSQAITVRTMLIGQAVCQTPAIFGMLVAFIMLFTLQDIEINIIGFAKIMGAAIAVGFGGIGPGIGCGLVGDTSCAATAAKPDSDALFLRTMLIGQAVSQSTAIYSLIIALVLLFVI